MNVTSRRVATLLFAGALALAGCQGSQGEAGQDGNNGTPGDPGNTGPGGPTGPTGPGGIPGVPGVSSGLKIDVVSVTKAAAQPISVRFTMKDDRGFAVDINGVYSVNTVFGAASSNSGLRFALAYVTKDASSKVQPYKVLTNSGSTTPSPTAFNAFQSGTTAPQGTIVQNGPGDYTFTFPTTSLANGAKAVAYDAAAMSNTHVVWIQATRQTNLDNPDDPKGFAAVNQDFWFVPDDSAAPEKREVAAQANCDKCHRGFAPGERSISASTFHSGGRVDVRFCGICHNPGRTSNKFAEAKVFVHRLHNSENLQDANLFHAMKFAFPQDIRNCDACHANAAQGAQAKNNPTTLACGSCHDYVDFSKPSTDAMAACQHPPAKDANGVNLTCRHTGNGDGIISPLPYPDSSCTGCHAAVDVAGYHTPVAPPDPASTWAGGTNGNTNAAFLAAAGAVPPNAKKVTYEVASVDAVTTADPLFKNPSIKFRFLVNGVATPMQAFPGNTEILPGFVGSPSVYFAFAVPQDGIAAPADFNASASAYIRSVWNGTVLPAVATITGPDASQYYTVTLTGTKLPAASTNLLTGGIGYTYALASTQPLTQIDLPAYPYNVAIASLPYVTAGTKQGGLIVPAPNVWKVGTGFTARRAIVDNEKCKTCHVALGAAPTFHAGQRNDGPTCSFCHTPNRTSSGWSATAKNMVHSIHAGRVRTEEFNWHAPAPGETYGEVEFPGAINDCTACHLPGGFNFTATGGAAAMPNLLPSTVGQGRYNGSQVTNPNGWFSLSPYVVKDNTVDYGFGFATSNVSYNLPDGVSGTQAAGAVTCSPASPCVCTAANPCTVVVDGPVTVQGVSATFKQGATTCSVSTPCTCVTDPAAPAAATKCTATLATCSLAAPCNAQSTTLVISPIAAACVGCHDSPVMVDHMQANGGKFYEPRATLASGPAEQCMLCHGKGTIAPIADVHK
jgi:OmcA/MtrC family decaheme c-type cytochrome